MSQVFGNWEFWELASWTGILGTPAPNNIDEVKKRCGEFLVEQAYINGKFVSTGKTFAVDDPSCDQPLAHVTVVDAELTNQAIAHAKGNFLAKGPKYGFWSLVSKRLL